VIKLWIKRQALLPVDNSPLFAQDVPHTMHLFVMSPSFGFERYVIKII